MGVKVVQYVSMSGCGTHLMMGLLEQAGYHLLIDEVKLLQAYILARRDPALPAPITYYFGQPVLQVFAALATLTGFPEFDGLPDEDALLAAFAEVLAKSAHDRFAIIHSYSLNVSRTHRLPDGSELHWRLADRDELQALFGRAMARAGCDFRRVAFIRNPVDIYFSHRERQDRDALQEIREFFDLLKTNLANEDLPVIKFEEFCMADRAAQKETLGRLAFDEGEIARLDLSIVQNGEIEKWIGYPSREVRAAGDSLEPRLREFGYSLDTSATLALKRIVKRYRKYRSEFSVINRICRGDYSVDGAFSKHRRSLPARLWLRFLIFFPAPARHLATYYRTVKNSDPPMRSWSALLGSALARLPGLRRRPGKAPADG